MVINVTDGDEPVTRFLVTLPRKIVKQMEEVASDDSGSASDETVSDVQVAREGIKDLLIGYLAQMVTENTFEIDDEDSVREDIRVDRLPDTQPDRDVVIEDDDNDAKD
jgi:hypothetical protein